jgi:hypothetical protein
MKNAIFWDIDTQFVPHRKEEMPSDTSCHQQMGSVTNNTTWVRIGNSDLFAIAEIKTADYNN